MDAQDYKTYQRSECVTFLKTHEPFGGLSNMAGGYPLFVNNVKILTSEALYQACRFPHLPEVQKIIIGQNSPMTAKMKSKPYRKDSRPDWETINIQVMFWCLRVKLAQNWEKFGDLLLSTEDRPIVEESYRDQFWGAKPVDAETLVGANVLGRLLMKLRDQLRTSDPCQLRTVKPLTIPDFLFIGEPIGTVEGKELIRPSFAVALTSSIDMIMQEALPSHHNGTAHKELEVARPVEATPVQLSLYELS